MSEEKKLNPDMMELAEDALDAVAGGVANPLETSDEYLIKTLNLTDQQAKNMTSAGTFSRSFYVDKLTEQQQAEYESLKKDAGIMKAGR